MCREAHGGERQAKDSAGECTAVGSAIAVLRWKVRIQLRTEQALQATGRALTALAVLCCAAGLSAPPALEPSILANSVIGSSDVPASRL